MTLDLERLPDIAFVTPDGCHVLTAERRVPAVNGRAARFRTMFVRGDRIGLIGRTGPDLVLDWLAALAAELVPTILQYPTAKQNWRSWANSISHLVEQCELAGLVLAEEVPAPTVGQSCLIVRSAAGEVDRNPVASLVDGQIIQMSSGTTGQRKPIGYPLSQIAEHVTAYAASLRLTSDDVIVSWLPLYHDMGFIASFLMPLIRGVPLVLIDPSDWVAEPGLLFDTIRGWRGSICYMPNFAFEVMARCGTDPICPTMRRWISCAEPVSATTVRRFLAVTETPASAFSACYGMAENVFAVAQSDGFLPVDVEGKEAVSCGIPVAQTALKLIDGEIWIRSPVSLKSYLDGPTVTDPDGFHATGDMGVITGSGVVILGRRHDILIQAGVKHFLSDLDQQLNEAFPEARGRVCAMGVWDDREGTERPVLLVERDDFFDRSDLAAAMDAVRERTGLTHFTVDFVPPFFISKTSSGKPNRRETARQWTAVVEQRSAQDQRDLPGIAVDLQAYFDGFASDVAVDHLLDSLGTTILRIILADYGLQYEPTQTLGDILAAARDGPATVDVDQLAPGLSIVSCADGRHWAWMTLADVEELERRIGCPVHFEHICAPPAPILLSDLIFHDYFLPGRKTVEAGPVANLLSKIRSASLLLFDDIAELGFGTGPLPALSHRFQRDPAADLISVRWQRYTSRHDALPITVTDLSGTSVAQRGEAFARLRTYLGIPLFRIAVLESQAEFTQDWEYREIIVGNTLDVQQRATPERLREALFAYVEAHADRMPRRLGLPRSTFQNADLPHFCCGYVDAEKLDRVLARYDSFLILGPPQSVPYIRMRAQALGKPVRDLATWNQDVMGDTWDFDLHEEQCVLITGAWGRFTSTNKPVFQVMMAWPEPLTDHVPSDLPGWGCFGASLSSPTSPRSHYKAWT